MKRIKLNNKSKQISPKYIPVFINSMSKENRITFILRMIVKVLLVCLSCTGLCVTLAQIYRIPVSLSAVVLVGFASVAVFNVIFILFKKRVLLLAAIAFLIIAPLESVIDSVTLFVDHILHILESRLIFTARFAIHSFSEITTAENSRSIAAVFLVVCILIALVFTLGARSRFIGIMLITTVCLLTPAFGAEIAEYVWGMNLLIAAMIGVYCMWVAHAWENFGGIHQISYSNKKTPDSKTANRDPIYKLTPGSLPYFYKYSRNSLMAVILAFVSVFIAANVVSSPVKFDFHEMVNTIRQVRFDLPGSMREFFKHNFGSINDNGFFPDISSGTDISTGITMGRPPSGNVPIIKIHLEDDWHKIYLRGGIGIDFTGDEWTTMQSSPDFEQLLELLDDFSPELEYHTYQQRLERLKQNFHWIETDVMGTQNIKIEYLSRTGFLLLPTQPYDFDFKNHPDYTWHLDTHIKPNKRITSTEFKVIFPKIGSFRRFNSTYSEVSWIGYDHLYRTTDGELVEYSEFSERYAPKLDISGYYSHDMWDEIQEIMAEQEQAWEEFFILQRNAEVMVDSFAQAGWDFPDGTHSHEYNEKIKEYRRLIHSVYTNVPQEEIDNIDELLGRMRISAADDSLWGTHRMFRHRTNYINALEVTQIINNYLRRNYAYSLDVDNMAGDNTTIGNFLHDTQSGHCAMYASAMVLTMRRLGFPARYITGIVTVPGAGIPSDYGYEQTMSERDFHAWVEVYIDGIGWLPFDPTGGAHGLDGGNVPQEEVEQEHTAEETTAIEPDETQPPAEETTAPAQTTAPETTGDSSSHETEPNQDDETNGINLALIAIIGLGILIPSVLACWIVSVFKRLKKAEAVKLARFKNSGGDKNTRNKAAREMYRFMLRLLEAERFTALTGETPLLFAKRIDEDFELDSVSLKTIMPVFEKLEFNDLELTELTQDEYDLLYGYVLALYGKVVSEKKAVERVVRRFRFAR
jgi:hypothetical protein